MLLHEFGCQTLDGVGAGLVHGLAAGHVVLDLLFGQRREPDRGGGIIANHLRPAPEADAGQHFVPAAGKQREHAARIGRIRGLGEHLASDHDGGIGAEHDLVRRRSTARAFASARRRT